MEKAFRSSYRLMPSGEGWEIMRGMVHASVLTEEFAEAVAEAGSLARKAALAAGHPVVFMDSEGRCVEEWPDGRKFEIRLDATQPGGSRRVVIRELQSSGD